MPVATTLAISAGAVAGLAVIVWPVATWIQVATLEKPQFDTLAVVNSKRRGIIDGGATVEVRRYAPYLVAKVTIDRPEMREAVREGFKKIAGFIFGGNEKVGGGSGEKISMTVPVQTTASGGSEKISMTTPVTAQQKAGGYEVSFVMPSKYTLETLPKPKDRDVKIEECPPQTFGVISWRGGRRPDEQLMSDKRAQLVSDLRHAGVRLTDQEASTRLWQYFPPFAPDFIKLYELLLPVEAASVQQSSAARPGKKQA